MTVIHHPALMVGSVWMESTGSCVNVHQDLQDQIAELTLMNVLLILVDLEAHVLMALASSAASVLLGAKVCAVKKVSFHF